MQEKGFMPKKLTLWERVRKGVVKVWRWTLTCLLLRAEDLPEPAKPTPHRRYNGRIHPWTDVHSWLVVMGGLSFEDSAEEDQQFMPEKRHRIYITIPVFKLLSELQDHLIPDIPREMIEDKRKSDRLAKMLTCWQAVYFCVQCASRLPQQFSVTLLELNVFAHALCALALYAIWSNKPRDICEPILIVGEEAMDICASLCLHVFDGNREYFSRFSIITDPHQHPGAALEIVGPTELVYNFDRDGHIIDHLLKVSGTYWVLKLRDQGHSNRRHQDKALNIGPSFKVSGALDAQDVRRLQRVSKFVQREKAPKFHLLNNLPLVDGIVRTTNWSLDFATNFEFMLTSRMYWELTADCSRFAWLVAGMTFAGSCYGGLHLVAWTTTFASHTESLLWRASSVSIMVAGPFCVLIAVCNAIGNSACFSQTMVVFAETLFCASIPWYMFCRVFIIVESFIMLAHIPDQALQVPTWSAYVPHIA